MENKNQTTIDNQVARKATNILGIGLAVVTGIILVATIASAFVGPSTRENMEAGYALMIEGVKESSINIDLQISTHNKLVEACELQEQSIAKKKLEEHYAGTNEIDTSEIERLTAKAEGRNLACGGFQKLRK